MIDDNVPQRAIAFAYATIWQMIRIGRINSINSDHVLRCIEEACQESMKGYEDECNELIQKTLKVLKEEDDTTRP